MPRAHPTLVAAMAMAVSACGPHLERFAVTKQARPLTSANAEIVGRAPPAARGVTGDRIARARGEPQNWLTYYGAYDGWRFSALDQIDRGNVRNLRVAWIFQAAPQGLIAGQAAFSMQAAPIVVDGVMYLAGPDGWVWALDGATGRLLWQFQHAVPLDQPLCCGTTSRGVAVAEGKVFTATPDGHLIALDAERGTVVWDRTFVDARSGESSTGAPLVVRDLVIVGSAGAEFGVRGHIDAFAIADGRHAWRRYNVPRPGEPGSETWPGTGDAWARGGGTSWVTGTYDPELDLVFWGVANPGPLFDGSMRAGDNLYTNSIVAFSPRDGSLRWYFQMTPHDVWDYDGVSEPILIERGGRKLVAHFDKNGHYYLLDRTNGHLLRVRPFARVTWAQVDSLTGRPAVRLTPTAAGTRICPGAAGAKEWTHASFSPRTGLLYVPVVEQCGVFTSGNTEFREGLPYWGSSPTPVQGEYWGYVKAVDPETGRSVWERRTRYPMVASLLTTAGDLVFAGEPNGMLDALDARTGDILWSFNTGNGLHGNPVSYAVNGKQYVAVPVGWGGWTKGFAPELAGASHAVSLVVFALP
ncbi:MAG TPA: PQQ-dependent dehydrogenase, methanol/ethanol family [Longimicrobiaceae bacterium]